MASACTSRTALVSGIALSGAVGMELDLSPTTAGRLRATFAALATSRSRLGTLLRCRSGCHRRSSTISVLLCPRRVSTARADLMAGLTLRRRVFSMAWLHGKSICTVGV
ncbi:hypothetical protein B0J12DRAFT_664369 [Macrophomina phaseolina]|uniref:Secreted protein n=1 Tax=Macrophomina phaseolina TaxID=35725 RepID=A0ABQ8GA96_9PEZI|nr:hypothetical protein B0J12DRAFT_664369 [Macrophomina phaseolina]